MKSTDKFTFRTKSPLLHTTHALWSGFGLILYWHRFNSCYCSWIEFAVANIDKTQTVTALPISQLYYLHGYASRLSSKLNWHLQASRSSYFDSGLLHLHTTSYFPLHKEGTTIDNRNFVYYLKTLWQYFIIKICYDDTSCR